MAYILGIKLSDLKPQEIKNKILEFLNSKDKNYLVTPNPEMILASQKDEELFYILNKASLAPADGFGLRLAALLQGKNIQRLSGSDLSPEILKLAEDRGDKVLIVNWQNGLSKKEDIEKMLREKYTKLNFLVLDLLREINISEETLLMINNFSPKIMFCSFGSPYQEKFIYHNLNKISSLSLALAVGGSFDFLTNKLKRAPLILRQLGLEWFWRLVLQPKRWKRIYNATFVFSFKVITSYFKHFCYRPNVVCLVYKKIGDKKFILVVEREDEANHWQIPQGGTDGESLEKAALKELKEEPGNDKFIIKKSFENLFKYQYFKKDNEDHFYKFEYKGQKQSLVILEFLGSDEDIKINYWDHRSFKWLEDKDLISNLHPQRKPQAKIFLDKFYSISL